MQFHVHHWFFTAVAFTHSKNVRASLRLQKKLKSFQAHLVAYIYIYIFSDGLCGNITLFGVFHQINMDTKFFSVR